MFKKKPQPQSPLEVVLEIHKKVLSSGDDCLKEAQAILASKESANLDLYAQMKANGFGNTKEIKEKDAEIKVQAEARAKAKLISEYSMRYTQKFISTEEMEKICNEYNLVLGANGHFTGSMPERSMREIVNFKLNPIDEIYYEGKWRATEALRMDKTKGVIEWKEITKERYNEKTNNGTVLVSGDKRTHFISNKDYCMIGAPIGMFNIEGMVREGNTLKKVVEVDDPVCLKVVRHGYIVVAVWGEEIAIEKMQNPKMN